MYQLAYVACGGGVRALFLGWKIVEGMTSSKSNSRSRHKCYVKYQAPSYFFCQLVVQLTRCVGEQSHSKGHVRVVQPYKRIAALQLDAFSWHSIPAANQIAP